MGIGKPLDLATPNEENPRGRGCAGDEPRGSRHPSDLWFEFSGRQSVQMPQAEIVNEGKDQQRAPEPSPIHMPWRPKLSIKISLTCRAY